MHSKDNAQVARRGVSDRELESLLRRTAKFYKLHQSSLVKKVQPIRKAPVPAT